MNYKETLLMPETSFQMRGNLPENEKLQRNIQQLLESNQTNK